jgi:hypothetical protein
MMMMTNILKLKASYSNWVYYYTILTIIAYINKAYFSQTFLTCMQVYYFFLHSFLSQGHFGSLWNVAIPSLRECNGRMFLLKFNIALTNQTKIIEVQFFLQSFF